eukprot:TRINITY_DN32148_c0_g1_i1.p1 TRINITY_DN32148_c0_g1~~TRINITY_DN32148_c0_g1_i1.p1  ORF type:complete len:780 (+),score=149.59 TRINITY_DN32148_c0_g1_i1:44-2383(+)
MPPDVPPDLEARLLAQLDQHSRQLETDPTNTDLLHQKAVVLTDLGTQLKLTGRHDEALSRYQEALEFDAGYADAYYNLGVFFSECRRDVVEAERQYRLALERSPCYAEAACNLGVILKERGEWEAAHELYMLALKYKPNFEIVHKNMAILLTDIGVKTRSENKPKEAIRLFKQALEYNHGHADAYYNLGVSYASSNRLQRAVYYYNMAVACNQQSFHAFNNLGVLYKMLDRLDKSVEAFSNALRIYPGFVEAMNNLGMIYTMMGKDDEAIALFKAAIEQNPSYAVAYNNLGVLLRDEGKVEEAMRMYDLCLQHAPGEMNPRHNILLAANYRTDFTLQRVQDLHLDWGRTVCANMTQFTEWSNDTSNPDRRLVIGYVSPDFFYHSVSYFTHNVLLHHDHEKFKIVAFVNLPKGDAKTQRLKALVDEWVNVHEVPTAQACELIRQQPVDILIDLTGHTSLNRLDIFASRPSPVSVSWIGYPNTTGLPTIDYRFTDSVADPPDKTDPVHYSEELIRLDPCFLCYNPDTPQYYRVYPGGGPDEQKERDLVTPSPDPIPPPCLKRGYLMVGTFNSISKVTPPVVRVWSRILTAVPNMVLVCKSKPLVCQRLQDDIKAQFAAFGVAADRLQFSGVIPNHNVHLGLYNELDIALDCWPYAGTTTSCEALYMSVPLVTLRGEHHFQSVGASLLNAIGLNELIADTEDDYVRITVELANDTQRLQRYKQEIRERMLRSPLCDGASFTRRLERQYRDLWRRYCTDGPRPQRTQPAASTGTAEQGSPDTA